MKSANFWPLLVCTLAAWLPLAQAAQPVASYVVLGPGGARIARVVTADETCPTLSVDGTRVATQLRSAPGTASLRPPALKPSAFPARTCEAVIPADAKTAELGSRPLPLPPAIIRRIVVIGDTGCRIKTKDKAFQACNDLNAYPFAVVARAAENWDGKDPIRSLT